MTRYEVPVTQIISGHMTVEVPGKPSKKTRLEAIEAAKKAWAGRDSIEFPSFDTDFCDDPDDVEIIS